MLIGEFARRTGLSQDTIRFYVRKGLLAPQAGTKGGRRAWQVFTPRDASAARLIRFAQSLGMSLKEIAEIDTELRRDGVSPERQIQFLDAQLARLDRKAVELAELIGYLRAKRDGIAGGMPGGEPHHSTAPCAAPI